MKEVQGAESTIKECRVVLTPLTSEHRMLFNDSGIKPYKWSLFISCELTVPVYVVLYCSDI